MVLEILYYMLCMPGFILGTFGGAALLWWLGLRQPFLLVLAALLLGGIGTWAELRLGERKRHTRSMAEK
jgi:hypothetical protein